MALILISTLIVLSFIAAYVDIHFTSLGISKGIAQEGNELISYLFGPRPTTKQLWIFEIVVTGLLGACALSQVYVLSPFCVGGLILRCVVGHLLAARKWHKLLHP